jgi:quinol monooxygenase YgiN
MLATSIRMTIEWLVPLGQLRPITIALHSVAAETRTTRGCLGCSVASDIGTRGTVRYVEEWLTEDDLRQRVGSDTFIPLVTLMEDTTQPPRIEFALAHQTRGLDFVEEVRASQGGREPSRRGGLR